MARKVALSAPRGQKTKALRTGGGAGSLRRAIFQSQALLSPYLRQGELTSGAPPSARHVGALGPSAPIGPHQTWVVGGGQGRVCWPIFPNERTKTYDGE